MTLKDTINGVVKPKVYDEGDKTGLLISEDFAKKPERAAMLKSRSRIENVQGNDLNIEISQRDIDKAAKKYHKEMRNRRRQQNGGNEAAQLQHGFLPVLTQVLFNEIQEQDQEVHQETQAEMRPRSRLRSHLKHPKHRRPQMANHEHGQRRERPRERANQAAQEASSRRLEHLKQRPEGVVRRVEDYETLNHQPFRTQEELLQEAAHIRLGNPMQLRLQDEQAQIANDELSHKARRRQKHAIRQHTWLENPELSLESEESDSRQRCHKNTRQHQQSPESTQDTSSRQRHQRNHRQAQGPRGDPPQSSETVSVPCTRHNRQRRPQAGQAQIWEEGSDTPSRQRRQRHLAQQHGPPESPHSTDSESRLRHIVQQQSLQVPGEGHFALHQGTNLGIIQTHLGSPILNDLVSEELRANQRRPRVHNSPRILHPCDRLSSSEENTPQNTPSQEDRPPSDEYYAGNEAEIPPYHATLHKYLDLISYDPRVVPCLRVNRSLIKSNDKLSESIFQFLKFNLFPESIDPWEISHIDDQHYDDLIPDLIPVETDSSDVLPNIPYESHYRHHNNMVPQVTSDDDYEYALYLSTLENNVHNYATGMGSTVRG